MLANLEGFSTHFPFSHLDILRNVSSKLRFLEIQCAGSDESDLNMDFPSLEQLVLMGPTSQDMHAILKTAHNLTKVRLYFHTVGDTVTVTCSAAKAWMQKLI